MSQPSLSHPKSGTVAGPLFSIAYVPVHTVPRLYTYLSIGISLRRFIVRLGQVFDSPPARNPIINNLHLLSTTYDATDKSRISEGLLCHRFYDAQVATSFPAR